MKGFKNIVSAVLSRQPKQGDIVNNVEAVLLFASEDEEIFPIEFQLISNIQSKDRELRNGLNDNPKHYNRRATENVQLMTKKDKIFVP